MLSQGGGKDAGFMPGILRSGKSEIILKNRSYSMKAGTVDDFDCSYFKTFHATRHWCSGAGARKNDLFKDNASQDSYRLQESRDSLNDDLKNVDNAENMKGNIHVVNADFHSGEDFVEVTEKVFEGKKEAEELKRKASLKSQKAAHDSRMHQFSRVRSTTMAHDPFKDHLNNQFTGQSYSTDIDSVLSPIDNKPENKNFEGTVCEQTSNFESFNEFPGEILKELLSPSQLEEEECITIIDSKEDGIQYYLHKKSTKQTERSASSYYGKIQTDQTKSILEEVKMKILKPERKTCEYISSNKLPHRDAFSSRDDTVDNDVFFKNDDPGVWRKFDNNIDARVKQPIKHKSTKEFTTRGRILSESDSEHLGLLNNKNKEAFIMKDYLTNIEPRKDMKSNANMSLQLEDELNLSECADEDEDKSCFSNFENELSEKSAKQAVLTPSTDNVNPILYKRRACVLPYNELVKLDLAFISEKENYGRHYFCTIDQDLFHKGESSSDNDRFSWMAIPRYRQSFKSSISYRTGYATGSSSSLSIAEELESGYRPDAKPGRAFQPHQIIRISSGETNATHIDKRGHVIEWLEEQQALLEPSSRPTYSKNDLRLSNRLAALKGSLPAKVRHPSLQSSHSSKHLNMHNQSSFSTQSFPEPVMEISSDECPMASKPNTEGFYDVNRILDYVADSNRYINPQLLGYTNSSEYNNENHQYNKDFSKKEETNVDKSKHKVSKFSSFDAGRYRIFSKDSKNCLHSLSIDPEKMFNSELKRLVQRSSQSSQNNEEDHVSDILDAIGMAQPLDSGNFEYSSHFQGSLNRVINGTQTLNDKLNEINFSTENQKSTDKNNKDYYHEYNNLKSEKQVEGHFKAETGYNPKMEMVSAKKIYPTPRKFEKDSKNFTTENICTQKILAPVRPISLKTNFIGHVETKVENKTMKKPIMTCDTLNLQLENRKNSFVVDGESLFEVIKVEVGERVVKKTRPKPRKIPDKFELFLAGVKVNLSNIVDRDSKCENLKECIVKNKHVVDRASLDHAPTSLSQNSNSFIARKNKSIIWTYPK